MAYFETKDGVRLFYRDWGTGDPVVLVHGWCINCDSWEYVMAELPRRGLRCIAYDQRGCGRSDQPWTRYDYDTLSGDLATLLETLDLTKVTLVGHSMGTGVIARYLSRYGDARVARAVLVSTTMPLLLKTGDNPDGIDEALIEASATAIRKDRALYTDRLVPSFFGENLPSDEVSQAMIDWGMALTLQASPQAAVEMLRTSITSDMRAELKTITTPILIVHGDADPSSPLELTARRTHALLPNSRLVVYAGAAHGLYINKSAQLNDDLAAFIQEE